MERLQEMGKDAPFSYENISDNWKFHLIVIICEYLEHNTTFLCNEVCVNTYYKTTNLKKQWREVILLLFWNNKTFQMKTIWKFSATSMNEITLQYFVTVSGRDESWPAVNKWPTLPWSGYFLTQPKEISFDPKEKIWDFLEEIFIIQTQTKDGWPDPGQKCLTRTHQ